MCNCPQPLAPPNEEIKRCRLILQCLGGGLIIITILAIVSGNIFSIFMYMLLLYMLYMSWSQFNWCFTLVFFLFCVTDFIQNLILLVGMIQYQLLFAKDTIAVSIYVIVSFFYFTTAIYFSHYAYRHFKAMNQQGLLGGMNFMPGVNPGAAPAEQPDYRRVQENTNNNNNNNNNNNGFFQGQGVMIG